MIRKFSKPSLVLVVDDNETGRYAKARTLREAGHTVLEAETGGDALRLVAERQPRLVVLDIQLPDIDGWEVCRRIKENPATASIAVLQVSATHVDEADTVHSLESGADGSLTEPLDPGVLTATVHALLRAREAEDTLREALAREQAGRAEAEHANRMKDEFLATLSHELRSPLSAILTWTTLLRSTRLDDDTLHRAYESIERSTRLQARMIEDLLDISRIASGKLALDVALLSVPELARATLGSVRPLAEAKQVEVALQLDPAFDRLPGDVARLQQILGNLLSNAIKFTPPGGRIELRFEREGELGRISVSDTGRGISASFLPHVFERFRQADSSSTRSEGGLGLGLAIVRHLTELHGGSVTAESAGPGRGSRFTLRLPLRTSREIATSRPRVFRPELPLHSTSLNGIRLLVLDDDDDARAAIVAVLEDCGADVLWAASARRALELLDEQRVDVIVSDIAMPGEDGFQFLVELRKRPATGETLALALTAYASLEEERKIRRAGFDAYLAKPIGASELAAAIEALARPAADAT